jgi:tetratricopeptide (TPR) repeat protein
MHIRDLWDFSQPALSEQRFREAIAASQDTEADLWRTQLARALGLQGRYEECAAELDLVDSDDPLVRVYALLERGRMLRSSGDPGQGADLFQRAFDEADAHGLAEQAADAAHMLAVVGPPEDQIAWADRALAIATASSDPRVRHWIGPVENNAGWTLHEQGRYDEALERFQRALVAREEEGDAESIRIARWSVARALRSLERYDEALAIQTDLHENGPEDGYVEQEMAELLTALGRAEAAAPYAKRADELLTAT